MFDESSYLRECSTAVEFAPNINIVSMDFNCITFIVKPFSSHFSRSIWWDVPSGIGYMNLKCVNYGCIGGDDNDDANLSGNERTLYANACDCRLIPNIPLLLLYHTDFIQINYLFRLTSVWSAPISTQSNLVC